MQEAIAPTMEQAKISEAKILYLAINERKKSAKFYKGVQQNVLGKKWENTQEKAQEQEKMWENAQDINSQNYTNNASNGSDESARKLHKIFATIAKKEQVAIAQAKVVFEDFSECEEAMLADESILLPSALPDDILQELLNEMGELDSQYLNILALGIESHHLKSSDFLIKQAQNLQAQNLSHQNPQVLDTLYQLQALSYNHHIPLLQGQSPKSSTEQNKQSTNMQNDLLRAFLQAFGVNNPSGNFNPTLNPTNFASLSDLARQSPILSEIQSSIGQIQNFYNQTKTVVKKLEKGELSQDELVNFLQKLHF
ncbi:hypothetical protein [Helicobacter macacae]|uniref:Uncharacterized protein n=1 Tax=Helicobacter macacae MIT 99-5501 TaxID=1357400 RepID=V8C885_9HELI|nr:hypothetical protein [Helicobacter macacae]ETD23292.1 hypothetical protein HMPREF2086_01091 [Helicobacter macacae MIT 99-5501]